MNRTENPNPYLGYSFKKKIVCFSCSEKDIPNLLNYINKHFKNGFDKHLHPHLKIDIFSTYVKLSIFE